MPEQYLTQEQRKQKTTKTVLNILGIIVFFGLAGWGMYALVQSDNKVADLTPTISEISDQEYVLGNRNAPVTLIEYGDFQCPACAAFSPIVMKLHQEFPDQLRVAFRHFPLPQHKNAESAAYAAEAAGLQGKFWEMAEKLYADQSVWGGLSSPQATYESYATGLGLDLEKFLRDFNDSSVKAKVSTHQQSGEEIGINSTPTFFLNGTKIANPPTYEQFRDLIAQEIK